ncbi:MAG: glycogen-binding domain-containing protein, partial [Myxococcota bacterium]|nr:glycogen-binding domain-containing protein [Myxococcota bacterium]
EVLLSGTFNDWATDAEAATSLVQTAGGVWTATVGLPGGVHQYKFIVDGQWMTDPSNEMEVDDGFGGTNSVLYVSCGETIDVAGLWESNGGFTADISNTAFVQDYSDGSDPLTHSVVLHDNEANAAIVQSGWDGTYEVMVWTDIAEDGSWWHCPLAVTGQASVIDAFEAEGVADATDPSAGGCGEANFAWNLMMPLAAPEPTTCETYCDLSEAVCTDENALDYADVGCLDACATWTEGVLEVDADDNVVGPATGDTVACRIYHLTVAGGDPALGGPGVHCPHAAHDGGGVCVDTPQPEPTICDDYCELSEAVCIDENALDYADVGCLVACATWTEGV